MWFRNSLQPRLLFERVAVVRLRGLPSAIKENIVSKKLRLGALIGGLAVCVLASLALLSYFSTLIVDTPLSLRSQTDNQTRELSTSLAQNQLDAKDSKNALPYPNEGSRPATSTQHRVVAERARISPRLVNGNARAFLNSNDLSKFDYYRTRFASCNSSLLTPMQVEERVRNVVTVQTDASASARFVIGSASHAAVRASIVRLNALCVDGWEGKPLTSAEGKAIDESAQMARLRAISIAAKNFDLDNSESIAALRSIITEPLYGRLESVLFSKLDYSDLVNAYPEVGVDALATVVIPLLLCRIGDDCGPDGFVTLQLCQSNGICGADAETALWAHLERQRIDTAPLRAFIDQRQRALTLLDFSILKSLRSKN
jgi:hypothetical protein